MSDQVLLNLGVEPRFDAIDAASIKPVLLQAMNEGEQAIKAIKDQSPVTWENTVEPLTDITERIGRIWGVISHLNSVADTEELRAVYNELMPQVTLFFTKIGQDIELYERFKVIKSSEEFQTLSAAQQTKLNHDLRDFVLSGAELPEQEQKELADLQSEGAQLAAQFSQNVLDATDDFSLYVDDVATLAGIPDYALDMFRAAAQAEDRSGYKIGLQMPHYLAVMQYADDRELREKLYRAYSTRASDQGNPKWDNTDNINRCLRIAQREAELLGFKNYAELSLATKMADTPHQVLEFLHNLVSRAKPLAQKEFDEVRQFALSHCYLSDVQAWDLSYVSEKLRQARYAFSEEEVKKYFPVNKVIEGLFAQIDKLYGIQFSEKKVPVWHPDVRYFELKFKSRVIGGVYFDLYARQGKRGGAWMNDYQGRRRLNTHAKKQLQIPIAYLVCNFTPPVENQQARLSHDEIVTLFHEMGHGLHHLLTQVDELGVSGINGVEWDAVEMPSQFMENFAWEYDVLVGMSSHQQTGDVLPKSLYQKMWDAKNFQRGLFIIRQMEFALFDMEIYSQPHCDWMNVLDQVRQEVAVIKPPKFNRFAHSFSHIFAGGYSAGYYSYSWAEVLSADIYAAFKEENNYAQTGQRFWKEILGVGGSRCAMDSFKAFRGREPSIEAFFANNKI